MSSYLFVAVAGGGALLEVEPLEDGILAEAFLDMQAGFLQAPFLVAGVGVGLALLLQGFVVGKEVELLRHLLLGGTVLVDYMVGGEVEVADEQVGVDNAVKDVCL